MKDTKEPKLDLRKIARSQGKLARGGSGLAEGHSTLRPEPLRSGSKREVPIGTSREDKVLPAKIIWPGDGGALRKSSKQPVNLQVAKE